MTSGQLNSRRSLKAKLGDYMKTLALGRVPIMAVADRFKKCSQHLIDRLG